VFLSRATAPCVATGGCNARGGPQAPRRWRTGLLAHRISSHTRKRRRGKRESERDGRCGPSCDRRLCVGSFAAPGWLAMHRHQQHPHPLPCVSDALCPAHTGCCPWWAPSQEAILPELRALAARHAATPHCVVAAAIAARWGTAAEAQRSQCLAAAARGEEESEEHAIAWSTLPSELNPLAGKVPPARAERKRAQIEALLQWALRLLPAAPAGGGSAAPAEAPVAVDFCAGQHSRCLHPYSLLAKLGYDEGGACDTTARQLHTLAAHV